MTSAAERPAAAPAVYRRAQEVAAVADVAAAAPPGAVVAAVAELRGARALVAAEVTADPGQRGAAVRGRAVRRARHLRHLCHVRDPGHLRVGLRRRGGPCADHLPLFLSLRVPVPAALEPVPTDVAPLRQPAVQQSPKRPMSGPAVRTTSQCGEDPCSLPSFSARNQFTLATCFEGKGGPIMSKWG